MKRNKYSLSHRKILTGNMGKLIPLTWYETLPGDTIQQSTSMLIRLSPLLAPVMHPLNVKIHHWWVSLENIWEDFHDFITGGEDGLDSTTHPYKILNTDFTTYESKLLDYMGIPPVDLTGQSEQVNVLPFRAYQQIYNDNYRDQQLQSEVAWTDASGSDGTTLYLNCNDVCWEKDYFTTCRADESLGDSISIPLTGDAPVYGIGKSTQTYGGSSGSAYETDGSSSTNYASYMDQNYAGSVDSRIKVEEDPSNTGYPNIWADTSSISGVDINDLRLSFALQKYQEARNRYGARYTEYVNYLTGGMGGRDDDKPLYLGGGKATLQISEVLEHSSTGTLGDMAGHGIGAIKTRKWRKFFDKHGIVMTLMYVLPKTVYMDGLGKDFSRTTKEDYYQKELESIGDEEVYNKELDIDHTTPDGVFGYQQRYDNYRSLSMKNQVHGEFRSTLDHWNFARKLTNPALNSTFVTSNPRTDPFASSATDTLYMMANHSIQARRIVGRRNK